MNTLILLFHVSVATLLVLSTFGVVIAGSQRQPSKLYETMLGSFGATLASGTVMLFVGLGGLGRICAAMSAVTLATVAARYYYLRRTAHLAT